MDAMRHGTYEIPIGGSGNAAWIIDYFWEEGTKQTWNHAPTPGKLESYTIHARFLDGTEQDMTDHIEEVRTLVGLDFGRVFDAIYAKEEAR
jgi:hypothetical protein